MNFIGKMRNTEDWKEETTTVYWNENSREVVLFLSMRNRKKKQSSEQCRMKHGTRESVPVVDDIYITNMYKTCFLVFSRRFFGRVYLFHM